MSESTPESFEAAREHFYKIAQLGANGAEALREPTISGLAEGLGKLTCALWEMSERIERLEKRLDEQR